MYMSHLMPFRKCKRFEGPIAKSDNNISNLNFYKAKNRVCILDLQDRLYYTSKVLSQRIIFARFFPYARAVVCKILFDVYIYEI